jgi:hypothetical protein
VPLTFSRVNGLPLNVVDPLQFLMLLPSKEREYAFGVVLDGTLQETVASPSASCIREGPVALGEEPPANPLTGKTPSLSVKNRALVEAFAESHASN